MHLRSDASALRAAIERDPGRVAAGDHAAAVRADGREKALAISYHLNRPQVDALNR